MLSTEALSIEPHRFQVDAYHRMIDAGVFDGDQGIELLEGVLVDMTPQGVRHARLLRRLHKTVLRAIGEAHEVLLLQFPLL